MAATNTSRLKTPGVYIEEIPTLPPSISAVETAIPAFVGYTERAVNTRGEPLNNIPYKITSMLDYTRFFGGAKVEEGIQVTVNQNGSNFDVFGTNTAQSKYLMFYSLQMFFANGGGECYIVSVGTYSDAGVLETELTAGLAATEKVDEITLYVFPDAQGLSTSQEYYNVYVAAIDLCAKLQDRFTVMDVYHTQLNTTDEDIADLRDKVTNDDANRLKYAASYYPNLKSSVDLFYGGEGSGDSNVEIVGNFFQGDLAGLRSVDNALYFRARTAIRNIATILPPSPAIVGIYARVDDARGVWKAPANTPVNLVAEPEILITDAEQEGLNIDSTAGKSVNVIRSFTGRGILVWGARTLAGNDNEWRYISVRRFFNMVEESAKKATFQFVFEPNDVNTWTRVKSMIENFLTQQWRAGALQGATTDQAFFVNVGLGETMTALDVLEGRMIVEIGMAVVRPAEFIVLQFMHKLPEA